MGWETAIIAIAAACGAAGPGRVRPQPVKEREDPVACRDCDRPTWSLAGRCVYCRLGWPDPHDTRRPIPVGQGVAGAEGPLRRWSPPTIRCPRCDAEFPAAPAEAENTAIERARHCPRCGAPIESPDAR